MSRLKWQWLFLVIIVFSKTSTQWRKGCKSHRNFNLSNITSMLPVEAGNASDNTTVALNSHLCCIILAAMAQDANTLSANAFDLALALATDASDGALDGLDDGASIVIPNSMVALGAATGLPELQNAIDTSVASGNYQTNRKLAQIALMAVSIGTNPAGTIYIAAIALTACAAATQSARDMKRGYNRELSLWRYEQAPCF
jgi:hypothetical protein